ncbi:hypothetical protein [Alcanivorax sp.]|jgi:hypothetical protein|uniref:hypothetical protein n=1 Tax=Alcanivorax sp. TaxID=1872427 RepID=UPI0032D8C665
MTEIMALQAQSDSATPPPKDPVYLLIKPNQGLNGGGQTGGLTGIFERLLFDKPLSLLGSMPTLNKQIQNIE